MLFDERFPRLTGQVVRSISLYRANFAFAPLPGSSVSVTNHNLCLFPDVCAACQTLGAFFKSKPWHQSLLGRAPDRGLLAGWGWAADLTFCGSSHASMGKYCSRWRIASDPSSRCSTRTCAFLRPGVMAGRPIW